jgi:hypothetical protein
MRPFNRTKNKKKKLQQPSSEFMAKLKTLVGLWQSSITITNGTVKYSVQMHAFNSFSPTSVQI